MVFLKENTTMAHIHKLPQWLGVTGQSGAGKGTIIEHVIQYYRSLNLNFFLIQNGALISKAGEENTNVGRKIKNINNQGKLQPLSIADTIIMGKILELLNEDENIYFIHDGSPRRANELHTMADVVESEFIKSLSILEVWAPEEACFHRLYERTKFDKRPDLSMEGKPGVPDVKKIKTKMGWYTENYPGLTHKAEERNIPWIKFENTSKIEDLRDKIFETFTI